MDPWSFYHLKEWSWPFQMSVWLSWRQRTMRRWLLTYLAPAVLASSCAGTTVVSGDSSGWLHMFLSSSTLWEVQKSMTSMLLLCIGSRNHSWLFHSQAVFRYGTNSLDYSKTTMDRGGVVEDWRMPMCVSRCQTFDLPRKGSLSDRAHYKGVPCKGNAQWSNSNSDRAAIEVLVVRGRQLVKKILYKCVTCRRFQGRPYHPLPPAPLPSLPSFWVNETRPFSYTGVDFAGPLYVKDTSLRKVWICLYTCCVMWASHLDIVPDMTAQAFIRALNISHQGEVFLSELCPTMLKLSRQQQR